MRILLVLVCVSALSCGGGGTAPAPTPSNPFTFTITSAGVSPKEFIITAGTRVAFFNNDTRAHDMASDPHPEHDECPELNRGLLSPGQSSESLNLVTVRTCGFHDHSNPDNATLRGRVIIR